MDWGEGGGGERKETLGFTSTETIKAYQGRGSWGGREILYLTHTRYTVTTSMILH